MRHFDRMIAFDDATGARRKAGVLLCVIVDAFLPPGRLVYVTPSTTFMTPGGANAADFMARTITGSAADQTARLGAKTVRPCHIPMSNP
jgi:hypothetical protein